MDTDSGRNGMTTRNRRRGMTFTEMIVSIAILLSLIALVYPVMSAVRKSAGVQQCVFNLRNIATAAEFYNKDNDPTGRGSRPTQPWHLGYLYGGVSYNYTTEFVYGGYRHTVEHPDFPNSDTYMIPTELRPYNKYIAPGLGGRFPIKDWICPEDNSYAVPMLGGGGQMPVVNTHYSCWQLTGNSYAINWYWPNAPPMNGGSGYWDLPCMSSFGTAMLQAKVGGAASEFILFMEGMMNAYMLDARPPDGSSGQSSLQMLGMGWHGKRSRYVTGFYDGHAEHLFVDTRYTSGPGWDTWPERATNWPSGCP